MCEVLYVLVCDCCVVSEVLHNTAIQCVIIQTLRSILYVWYMGDELNLYVHAYTFYLLFLWVEWCSFIALVSGCVRDSVSCVVMTVFRLSW